MRIGGTNTVDFQGQQIINLVGVPSSGARFEDSKIEIKSRDDIALCTGDPV